MSSENVPVFPEHGHTEDTGPVKKNLVIVNCKLLRKVINIFKKILEANYTLFYRVSLGFHIYWLYNNTLMFHFN